MKARALVLAATFLSISVSLSAQENETKETIGYSNVTEFGLLSASPRGVSLEGTTAHGFSINKQHHFGFGTGIGINLSTNSAVSYMPIFFNYRFYFKPEKTFSPHASIAIGGLTLEEGYGIYSSVTMGFRAGKFSFSSGLSFMPFVATKHYYDYYYDEWGIYQSITKSESKWSYPFGITIKCGFAF